MTNGRSPSPALEPVRTYRDFTAGQSLAVKARGLARDAALRALSLGRSPAAPGTDQAGWIRFPFYHHVFDDERKDFGRQLDFMAGLGDFIGLDDAVATLAAGDPIDGRYFCITFDDGFKNWHTNAMPVLLDKKTPAAFFLVTGYIGASVDRDRERLLGFYDSGDLLIEFLDWDDCREMASAGMTFGSHTVNHVHLADLGEAGVEAELKASKQAIETELGRACDHFCCPFGRQGIDFLAPRDPGIARRVGYKSFLAAHRGPMTQGGSEMMVKRDHLLAGWGNYQLRYFFS
ncbi:MAG: polysaccharide deacetylase family protein [Proteobacteria bacterium]|nr:polysaccharide deacetylase family protein [Pseudomonadota bacterium]